MYLGILVCYHITDLVQPDRDSSEDNIFICEYFIYMLKYY